MKQPWLIFILMLSACSNSGGTCQHYRISALTEARDRGMSILLHFYEKNKSFCEKQKEELESVIKDKKFAKIGAYRVIWGSEKDLQNFYHVDSPCALLVFKGTQLKTRISSDVGPELLKMALEQGL